jgi:hypothetical protein
VLVDDCDRPLRAFADLEEALRTLASLPREDAAAASESIHLVCLSSHSGEVVGTRSTIRIRPLT